MKKLILVLTVLMSISTMAFADTTFTDMTTHWSKAYVSPLTEKGIISHRIV